MKNNFCFEDIENIINIIEEYKSDLEYKLQVAEELLVSLEHEKNDRLKKG